MRKFTLFLAAGLIGCELTGPVLAQNKTASGRQILGKQSSAKQAYADWQKSTNESTRRVALEQLEAFSLVCPPKELAAALSSLGRAATDGKSREVFLAVCAKRSSPDEDVAVRQIVALQLADWHAAAGDYEAAAAALTAHIKSPDLPLSLRSLAVNKAALILADNLGKAADASSLLAATIATVSPEKQPACFAEMANARAAILHRQLHDAAGAEAETRRVLALGDTCPAPAYATAADRLVELLAEGGRTNEAASALLLLIRHASLPAAGFARKLIDAGAAPAQIEEALGLLRSRMATPFAGPAELQLRSDRLQPEVVELLLALGRPDEAVGECRVFALCTSDRSYPQAIELAARCFKSLDGDLGRANALLDFHSSAPPPPGANNPLFDLPALGDAVRAATAQQTERRPADWSGWINRAALYAWLDRPADSMDAARAAFSSCPMVSNSLQVCANAVARPLLLATRDAALGQRLADFLLMGSAGPDKIVGTKDDISDPFPEARRRLAYGVKQSVPVLTQAK